MTAPATAAGRALLAMGASVGSTTADYRLRLIEQIEDEARAQGAAEERARLRHIVEPVVEDIVRLSRGMPYDDESDRLRSQARYVLALLGPDAGPEPQRPPWDKPPATTPVDRKDGG